MASMYSREPCNNNSWTSHLSVLSPAFTFMPDREWWNNTMSPLTPWWPWNSSGVYYKCVLTQHKASSSCLHYTLCVYKGHLLIKVPRSVRHTCPVCVCVHVFAMLVCGTFTNTTQLRSSNMHHQRTCNCVVFSYDCISLLRMSSRAVVWVRC